MIRTESSIIRCCCTGLSLLLLGLLPSIVAAVFAAETSNDLKRTPSEYEVKAAYLYYFAKFVEWPAQSFTAKDSSIIIGIAGDDPFGPILDETISGKTVQGRGIVIRRFKSSEDSRSCHIVFISLSEANRMAQTFETLQNSHVLTVSELEQTARSKCIINFVMEGGRVQFEVDVKRAEKAGLKISSKLMMVARVLHNDISRGRD